MLNGPVVMSAPNRPRNSRAQLLNMPMRGDSSMVHDTANSSPGIAIGSSINPQARLRSGMSVRSVRNANTTAMPTDIAVLATAITTVLKKIVYVSPSE